MKTPEQIKQYWAAYDAALADVRAETSGTMWAQTVRRACLIRKWARRYEEAVIAEARNRALNELRAVEATNVQ